MQKAPMAGRGFSLLLLLALELLAAGDGFVMPAADSSLALGALSMHRSGLEAALLQAAHDLVEKRTFDSIRTYGIRPRYTYA